MSKPEQFPMSEKESEFPEKILPWENPEIKKDMMSWGERIAHFISTDRTKEYNTSDYFKSLSEINLVYPNAIQLDPKKIEEYGVISGDYRDSNFDDPIAMGRRYLDKYREEKKYNEFIDLARALKILKPDLELELTKKDWREMQKNLEEFREGARGVENKKDFKDNFNSALSASSYFVEGAASMKIISPEHDFKLDENTWKEMEKILGLIQEKAIKDKKTENEGYKYKNWSVLARMAASMKILNPEYDPNLDETSWEGMRRYLEDCRILRKRGLHVFAPESSNIEGATEVIMAMKILASPKIEIPDGGGLKIK